MGNETRQALTWGVFRALGFNPRLISGEQAGRTASQNVEVDVRILVERIKWTLTATQAVGASLRQHWAEWDGRAAEKSAGSAIVEFGVWSLLQQRLSVTGLSL